MPLLSNNQVAKTGKLSRLTRARNKIFIGLMLATPVMATLWIFNFLLRLTTSWFPRHLLPNAVDDLLGGYLIQLIVLIFLLLIFYVLGELAHNFLGKRLYNLADRIFSGIPIIKNIYTFVRQLCEWVAKSRNTMFNAVVLVEYPRKNCYVIGMVTAKAHPAIAGKIKAEDGTPLECVSIFVATTPNPTSGFFIIVPKRDTIPLDMDISEAINLIISAGAILPEKTATGNGNSMLQIIDSLIMKHRSDESEPPAAQTP
ncbi:MAG: DUF502 domain-containing protein [Kiritimatiellae bacterium]|nr:DUF502 domain-containing protein [Kiritimatiellia bacterium]